MIPKKFMTDAHIANVSHYLKEHGVDCETVHKRINGNEDSKITIKDPEIVKYLQLQKSKGDEITIICNDADLAGHCEAQQLAVRFIPDLVLNHVKNVRTDFGLNPK